jgi:hypothetical protein
MNFNLHGKYPDLHRSPEVLNTVRRDRARQGEDSEANIDLSKDPDGRIKTYLKYLRESTAEGNPRREEKLRRFKQKLHEKYCLAKAEQIPDSYWKSVQENHRREGREVPEITDELKQELAEPIIEDQTDSLDAWIDYLSSPDAKYPDELAYWAFRSMLKMGRYDKEKQKFVERYGGAISPFPELNQQAFALVIDAMVNKHSGKPVDFGYDITEETKQSFLRELDRENFAKLYAIAVEEFKPISEELLKITDGEWRSFPRGSSAQAVVDSLKNHGSGWCIRGFSTAQTYLKDFDLEVYYSNNEQGESVVPRLVLVRFPDGRVSEFRGVAKKEEHDPHIGPVVAQKLAELGSEGEQFSKRKSDVDALNVVYEKVQKKEQLTRAEIIFLYEIDANIEGFGYEQPPKRVKELRGARKEQGLLEQDMLAIFVCTKEQIATSKEQLAQNKKQGIETKAYVGPIHSIQNFFVDYQNLEHIYTSFPEGRIRKEQIAIGGKTADQMETKIDQLGFKLWGYAQHMMHHKDFTTLKKEIQAGFVRLTVRDLFGDNNLHTTDEIYKKADQLGLDLCPAEVGPQYRIQYTNQPMNEWVYIAMKQISVPDGCPRVFGVHRGALGSRLDDGWAKPRYEWNPEYQFLFSLRKSETR